MSSQFPCSKFSCRFLQKIGVILSILFMGVTASSAISLDGIRDSANKAAQSAKQKAGGAVTGAVGGAISGAAGKVVGRTATDRTVVEQASKSNICNRMSRTCTKVACQSNETTYIMCTQLCPGVHTACQQAGSAAHGGGKAVDEIVKEIRDNGEVKDLLCSNIENIASYHPGAFGFVAKVFNQACPKSSVSYADFCAKAPDMVKKYPQSFKPLALYHAKKCQ